MVSGSELAVAGSDRSTPSILTPPNTRPARLQLATRLLVTTWLDEGIRNYLTAGGRVLLLDPEPAFAVEPTDFRLSSVGWRRSLGHGRQYEASRVTFLPSDGWCDLQFYGLIQGSKSVLLTPLPTKIEPLIRCIDRPTRLADRAYLFEVCVGRGNLLVSGLGFHRSIAAKDPAGTYLLDQLIRYAMGPEFKPKRRFPYVLKLKGAK